MRSFEWSQDKWVFEAGLPVDKKISNEGGFSARETSSGRAAKAVHVGPYEKTELAYKAVEDWINKNKKEKAGAPWEDYLNSPETTKADKLKTEIYFPIQ
jgi:effector-binding domain-containing protein